MRGVLIAFEGIDGSGKSTQAQRLVNWVRARGIEVVFGKEPTEGPWGQKIRRSQTAERLSPNDELEAFLNDRKEHVRDVIGPALERGAVVVLDRYYYSTVAYQGARGFDPGELLARNRAIAPKPDAVVLVDIDPKTALKRIGDRGRGQDSFEGLAALTAVRQIFCSLKEPHILTFDGTQDVDTLHRSIVRILSGGVLRGILGTRPG